MAISKLESTVHPLDEIDKINEIIDGKLDNLTAGDNIAIVSEGTWSEAEQESHLAAHNNDWTVLAYDGTKFIAINEAGYLSTSTDGITWGTASLISAITNYEFNDLIYDGIKFITVDMLGRAIATSSNGTTWSSTIVSGLNNYTIVPSWRSLAYDGTNFVIISSDGYTSTSENGTTWTTVAQRTGLGNNYWRGITYDGTKFVAIGRNGHISTSTDGIDWTTAVQNSDLGSHSWSKIKYDGIKFIALSTTGYTSMSSNGTDWTTAVQNITYNSTTTDDWGALSFDGTKFVALSTKGYISTFTEDNKTISATGLVKKTGDTMTGNLNISGDYNVNIRLSNTSIVKGTIPSTQKWQGVHFNDSTNDLDWENTRIGVIESSVDTSGNTHVNVLATPNVIGSTTQDGFKVTMTSSGVASCSFPNTTCVDGKVVDSLQTILSNGTSLNGSTNLTKRIDVPNDGHIYEVIIRGGVSTGSTSGNYVYLNVCGNQDSFSRGICACRTRTASSVGASGSCIVYVSYVTTNATNITIERNTSYTGTIKNLQTVSYRRVGTNS